jgi:hypothetical protein
MGDRVRKGLVISDRTHCVSSSRLDGGEAACASGVRINGALRASPKVAAHPVKTADIERVRRLGIALFTLAQIYNELCNIQSGASKGRHTVPLRAQHQ